MIRDQIEASVQKAIDRLVASGGLADVPLPEVSVEPPKQAEHGDFATNWAMVAFKRLAGSPGSPGNPRALANLLAGELSNDPMFTSVEVAGAGFVNLVLSDEVCAQVLYTVVDAKTYLSASVARPLDINMEFVSVNPNGPITIGSGRGAAYGSTLANVLEAAGHTVHREYYINDGVNSEQMRLFAESVMAILKGQPVPDNGYKGDYVSEVAEALNLPECTDPDEVRKMSEEFMIARQKADLEAFGVTFDTWFSEQSLHDSGQVAEHIEALEQAGVADSRPVRFKLKMGKGGVVDEVEAEPQEEASGPTLWLRSTKLGDDQDRVLRRADGRLTYISSDVAYHADKFNRGGANVRADKLITVLGPDHHGYIGRLHAVVAAVEMEDRPDASRKSSHQGLHDWEQEIFASTAERDACAAALAASREKLEVLIFQLVRFMKDGSPAPMRKRDGNIYALIDLINEIGEKVRPEGSPEEKQAAGRDVARFFYLMRHHDTTFDFDLNLAEKQSDDNPVFYVQYAHARICGVLRKAEAEGVAPTPSPVSVRKAREGAMHEREKALILKVADLGHEVSRCADDYAVSRLTTYAIELARAYHAFYDACRVLDPSQPETTAFRLQVCQSAKSALAATLGLLGVSAPESM